MFRKELFVTNTSKLTSFYVSTHVSVCARARFCARQCMGVGGDMSVGVGRWASLVLVCVCVCVVGGCECHGVGFACLLCV